MNLADRKLIEAARADYGLSNGLPSEADVAAREQAGSLILEFLGGILVPNGLRSSVLGTGWTERFQAQVSHAPSPERLVAGGWVDMEGLRGRNHRRSQLWAVLSGGEVLASVEIQLDDPPEPVEFVLERCRERGEVRLLDVLELRELRRRGYSFPASSRALSAAADIETRQSQRELVQWTTGRSRAAPATLPSEARARRVVAAFSGVDGAGKSSLVATLASDLTRASIPVTRVWLRPGMALGRLTTLASIVKRLLGQDPSPGIRRVAADAGAGTQLRSRRGALGATWTVLVTTAFVLGVRRQHAEGHGVLLYDRHLLDALATLEVAYGGTAGRLHRKVVRRLLPRSDVTFYLHVPAEVAVARKPGDPIGESAVRRQLSVYDRELPTLQSARVLDALLPTDVLGRDVFEHLAVAMNRGRCQKVQS